MDYSILIFRNLEESEEARSNFRKICESMCYGGLSLSVQGFVEGRNLPACGVYIKENGRRDNFMDFYDYSNPKDVEVLKSRIEDLVMEHGAKKLF
jgi:hypothetical protein